MNPNRPVSTLLRNQIQHLQEAEFRLPVKQQTNLYINAIKTEGQAAQYIRRVTQALHQAHGVEPKGAAQTNAAGLRSRPVRGRDPAILAEIQGTRKNQSARRTKAKGKARGKTKGKT